MATLPGWRAGVALCEAVKGIASADGWSRRGPGHFLPSVPTLSKRLTAAEIGAVPISIGIHILCCCAANGNSLRSRKSTWISSSLGAELARERCIPLECIVVGRKAVSIKFRR